MTDYKRDILRLLNGLVPAAAICTIPAILIWLDTAVFGMDCSETGIVETAQSLVLLTTVTLLSILVKIAKPLRGGLILATGFFSTLLIREQDAFLDVVYHGFWVVPALAVTVIALIYAWKYRLSIRDGLMDIRNNHHFAALTLGLFLLLGYSRVFGNKAIWKTICTNEFFAAKHAAEEGTELVAYAVIMYWAICYFLDLSKRYGLIRRSASDED